MTLLWDKDPLQNMHMCTNSLGLYKCSDGTFCGSPFDFGLTSEFDDVIDENFINYGVLTFDNIGKSLLTVFQILTNDNWAVTMYNLMDSELAMLSPLFLCTLVVMGSFFIINIILAVILDSFIRVQQEDLRARFILEHMVDESK